VFRLRTQEYSKGHHQNPNPSPSLLSSRCSVRKAAEVVHGIRADPPPMQTHAAGTKAGAQQPLLAGYGVCRIRASV
jgi:hypothetical protein